MDLVKDNFPNTLLLARQFYRTGPTKNVLTKENICATTKASQMWEAEAGEEYV